MIESFDLESHSFIGMKKYVSPVHHVYGKLFVVRRATIPNKKAYMWMKYVIIIIWFLLFLRNGVSKVHINCSLIF